MTKYQYESGKTYLSESTPITVSRIPSGTYKISVKKDDAVGEYTLTTAPGTQNVSIMAINSTPYDFSGAYYIDTTEIGGSGSNTFDVYGIEVLDTSSVHELIITGIAYDIGKPGTSDVEPYNMELTANITEPNGGYWTGAGLIYTGGIGSVIFTAYDSAENILQSYEVPKNVPTPKGDWDVSGLTMTGDRGLANTVVSGITGSDPVCTTIRFITTDEDPYYGIEYVDREVSNNNPNGDYNIGQGFIQDFEDGPKIVLLDANGDTIASTATFSLTLTGYPEL